MTFELKRQIDLQFDKFRISLENKEDVVIRRIAVFVLREKMESLLSDGNLVSQGISDAAYELVNSELIYDYEYDPELYGLIRVCVDCGIDATPLWQRLSKNDQSFRLTRVNCHIGNARNVGNEDEEARKESDRWKFRALTLIGKERLPDWLAKELEEYKITFGNDVRFAEEHVWESATWVGPTSPVSPDEMRRFDPDALLSHLASWHPGTTAFDAPSHEGQARVLSSFAEESPLFFAKIDLSFSALRPIYVRALLEGWTNALKHGKEISWKVVLDTCDMAIKGVVPCGFVQEGTDFDDDPSYDRARISAARFLEEAASRSAEMLDSSTLASTMFDYLRELVALDSFDEDVEARWFEDGSDALTASFNMQRSIALAGLVELAGNTSDSTLAGQVLYYVQPFLPEYSSSLGDAAAIGRKLACLFPARKEWVFAHKNELFGAGDPNVCQKTLFSVCVLAFRPHKDLAELLSSSMIDALTIGAASYPIGFTAAQCDVETAIGQWLLEGIANGYLAYDGLLGISWKNQASAKSKRKAVSHLCKLVADSETIPEEVTQRIKDTINRCISMRNEDCEVVSLRAIANLARSGFFEQKWWSAHFESISRKEPDAFAFYLAKEALVTLSEKEPAIALSIFEICVFRVPRDELHLWEIREAAVPILKNAFIEGGETAVRAQKRTNKLGFFGLTDLDTVLGEYLT